MILGFYTVGKIWYNQYVTTVYPNDSGTTPGKESVQQMKIVIIGGVAGGASAATRLRRLNETAEITVFERTGYISYANCGLPYYIGGEIEDRTDLTLQTPQSLWNRFHICVKVRHEVQSIDRANKTVLVKNLETGETFSAPYDKLVLAPGASPVKPPVSGTDSDCIFSLRTVEDCFRIYDYVSEAKPQTAVVIGGGFVGVEMAENLIRRGLKVSLVDMADQVLTQFDYDMACQIHAQLRDNGVELLLGRAVAAFEPCSGGITVMLSDGTALPADMAVMAVGVRPDSALAVQAGLQTAPNGAIIVNEQMQTSDEDIYAVGDAVTTPNFVTGAPAMNSLASPANKQGRLAADCICGYEKRYTGALATSVVKVFRMTAASTGLNEKAAAALGYDFDCAVITAASHASYYPNGGSMVMKVVFENGTGKLLGAQITGFDGVDKRIDVLATAMRAGLKAPDLAELDLAYAPPYSSAKDPVNMIGFVMENLLTGKVRQIHWQQLADLPRDGSVTLLDVRTPAEYERGHIDGFINIPLDDLRDRLGELPAGKTVYVNCHSALRSYIACRILMQNGFACFNLSGGFSFYDVVCRNGALPETGVMPCGAVKPVK